MTKSRLIRTVLSAANKGLRWLAVPVLSGIVGAIATLAVLRGISLEALANVLVAVGTFVLAYFTWKSVSRTGDVIAGEDRRHQQSFAPLVTVQARATQQPVRGGAQTGIRVDNVGYGLALLIEVTLEGVFSYSVTSMVEDTPENQAKYAGLFEPSQRSVVNEANFLNVTQRESEPFRRRLSISALESEGSNFQHEQTFFERMYGSPEVRYDVAVAEYRDMFGNVYKTRYLDDELSSYEWVQPKHLKLPANDGSQGRGAK